jgi:hypothetical protein
MQYRKGECRRAYLRLTGQDTPHKKRRQAKATSTLCKRLFLRIECPDKLVPVNQNKPARELSQPGCEIAIKVARSVSSMSSPRQPSSFILGPTKRKSMVPYHVPPSTTRLPPRGMVRTMKKHKTNSTRP